MSVRQIGERLRSFLSLEPTVLPLVVTVIALNIAYMIVQPFVVPGRAQKPIFSGVGEVVAFTYLLPLLARRPYPTLPWLVAVAELLVPLFRPELLSNYPHFYMVLLVVVLVTTPFLSLTRSVTLGYVVVKLEGRVRQLRGIRISRGVLSYALRVAPILLTTGVLGAVLALVYRSVPAAVISAFAWITFLDVVRVIATHIERYGTELLKKRSSALWMSLEYQSVKKLMRKIKNRIDPLVEQAGELIYTTELAAKVAVSFISLLIASPLIVLLFWYFMGGWSGVATGVIVTAAALYLTYYSADVYAKLKVNTRKEACESEYPVFLVFIVTMISAGMSVIRALTHVMELKKIFPRFSKEAEYIKSLVDRGYTQTAAVVEYATRHPSEVVRDFFLGYVHQLSLGTNLLQYLQMKLDDALETLKNKIEQAGNKLSILADVIIMVIAMPLTVLIVAIMIAPNVVIPLYMINVFILIPMITFMYVLMTPRVMMPNEYRINYIPGVVGGVVGAFIGSFLFRGDVITVVSVTLAGIGFGTYAAFRRVENAYNLQTRYMPHLFRDLAELRSTRSLVQAVESLAKLSYPRAVKEPLERMVMARQTGVRFKDQPYHSGAWVWRFFQSLLGKIEDSGGGTPEIFRTLMKFFTAYNNVISSYKAKLIMHEVLVYSIPVILGLILYTTMAIFTNMPNVSTNMTMIPAGTSIPLLQSQMPEAVVLLSKISILETSVALGLVVGRMSSGTILNTRVMAVASLISAIMLGYGRIIFSSIIPAPATP